MTLRQVFRLERDGKSCFHAHYSYSSGHLPGPDRDAGLKEWWLPLRTKRDYYFAFRSMRQASIYMKKGFEKDTITIGVLPHGVIEGTTQVVFDRNLRILG